MGTVILGKLESGSISKAQQLVMMPNRVRNPPFCFNKMAAVSIYIEPGKIILIKPVACSCVACRGGVKSPVRRHGDGQRRAWREPETSSEGH